MKIVEVVFFLSPGGAERFVVDLSNELSINNDVTLLVLRDETINPELRQFYKSDVSEDVKYQCLGLPSGISFSIIYKICKAISRINPDIVHYHGDNMPYWMIPAMAFCSSKIKFVQTIHSDIHNGYDTKLYKLLVALFGNRHRVRFAALSETNYRSLLDIYPKVKAKCIVNGRAAMKPSLKFDDVQREINQYRITSNTKIFLHVARCNPVKNQERLVRCFNKVFESGYDIQLLIIGDYFNTKEYGKKVMELAGNHIHFLGSKKNVPDYQLNVDFFCLSSDYEGMPITLLEALLSGTPAISTPVCGSIDAIENGVNGFVSEDFSDESYIDTIIKAINSHDKLRINTQAQITTNPYTIKECAKSYLSFFNE